VLLLCTHRHRSAFVSVLRSGSRVGATSRDVLRVRLAGRVRLGWPALSVFLVGIEFFPYTNQPEQYFILFFIPAEQAGAV